MPTRHAHGGPNILRDPARNGLIRRAHYPKHAAGGEPMCGLYPDESASKTVLIAGRDGTAVQQVVVGAADPNFILEQVPARLPWKRLVAVLGPRR